LRTFLHSFSNAPDVITKWRAMRFKMRIISHKRSQMFGKSIKL
jgi:hypothetical protein